MIEYLRKIGQLVNPPLPEVQTLFPLTDVGAKAIDKIQRDRNHQKVTKQAKRILDLSRNEETLGLKCFTRRREGYIFIENQIGNSQNMILGKFNRVNYQLYRLSYYLAVVALGAEAKALGGRVSTITPEHLGAYLQGPLGLSAEDIYKLEGLRLEEFQKDQSNLVFAMDRYLVRNPHTDNDYDISVSDPTFFRWGALDICGLFANLQETKYLKELGLTKYL